MQEAITKTVIDRLFAISQCRLMLTADDILNELIRQIDAKKVTQADVARHLGIPPPRVKERHKLTRLVQQREMKSLANFLGMEGAVQTGADPWLPDERSIVRSLAAGLEPLSQSSVPEDDLPILANAVSNAMQFLATDVVMDGHEGYLRAVANVATTRPEERRV